MYPAHAWLRGALGLTPPRRFGLRLAIEVAPDVAAQPVSLAPPAPNWADLFGSARFERLLKLSVLRQWHKSAVFAAYEHSR